MRKHVAAAGVYVRSSALRVLALLILMAATEAVLFFRAASQPNTGLENIIAKSGVAWVFCAAFVLLTVQLAAAGCDRGGRQGYTLARLSLSEWAVCYWQMAINALFYLLFWAVQGLLVVCFCVVAVRNGGALSGQELFLATWRSPFLHGLLPMGELICWGRNLVFLLGLGITTAKFGWCQRRGKFGIGLLFTAVTVIFSFRRPVGELIADLLVMIFISVVVAAVFADLWGKENEDGEAAAETP